MVSGEALESGSHVLSVPNAKRRAESILGILGILSGRPTHTVEIPRPHLSTLHTLWWNSSIAERNDDSAATRVEKAPDARARRDIAPKISRPAPAAALLRLQRAR